MKNFKASLLSTISICACIASPVMIIEYPLEHMSYTWKWSRGLSIYFVVAEKIWVKSAPDLVWDDGGKPALGLFCNQSPYFNH